VLRVASAISKAATGSTHLFLSWASRSDMGGNISSTFHAG